MAEVPQVVVPPAVVPNADVHAVLTVCGFANLADRTSLIVNEGFQTVADFGLLDEKDVYEMVKRLGARTAAAGRVNVGAIQVKKLQALRFWVRDQQTHEQAVNAADWNEDTCVQTIEKMRIEKGRDTGNVSVTDLGKFDPEDFETYETAFINLLAQTYGAQGANLKYVVRDTVVPAVFADDAERRVYQLPLVGEAFDMDSKSVYRLLKSFLVNTPGWTWIESFDTTENGRGAFLAWADHYNGQGELSKRTAMAKARVKNLFYKNERSLPFEKVTEILSKSFSTLDKDPDERRSGRQKVDKLLAVIQTTDMELVSQKAVIASQFPDDFSGACSYFSAQVSCLHGGAQLENRQYKKRNVSAVYGRGGRDGGRGGGRGRFGGRGRSGGRGGGRSGGRGGRGGDRFATMINGVDVLDPTRAFTDDEWSRLAYNGGQQYVYQARDRMNGRGRGGRGGRDGRGGNRDGGRGRNVGAAGSDRNESGNGEDTAGSSGTGGNGEPNNCIYAL